MTKPVWNEFDFEPVVINGEIAVETNKYSKEPICIDVEVDEYTDFGCSTAVRSKFISVDEARKMVEALNRAISAVNKVGKRTPDEDDCNG